MGAIGLAQTLVTISNGTSLSAAVPIGDHVPVGIAMPAGWDAAGLTFQVSCDGGVTFNELYDNGGNETTFTVSSGRYIPLDPTVWVGINHIKIRSGTAAATVNQTADRILTLVSRL
jgi:alpha-D-ribose 1-methylphosphonate 5-phosphate C-P lyase